jgi:hypothetical protein
MNGFANTIGEPICRSVAQYTPGAVAGPPYGGEATLIARDATVKTAHAVRVRSHELLEGIVKAAQAEFQPPSVTLVQELQGEANEKVVDADGDHG